MRGINAAQSNIGEVTAKYGHAIATAAQIQDRMGTLKEQASEARAEINRLQERSARPWATPCSRASKPRHSRRRPRR